MEHQKIDERNAIAEVKATAIAPITPAEQVLTPLQIADYSQFLYDTNFGGKRGKDFTAEGIKTIGLQNGISTGDVRVEFLNNEKTKKLFYCTATDANGNTSERVVKQCELENGRVNPHWIEKGIARAERNAIKARIPVQLFKTALQKAIAAGEAKQAAIVVDTVSSCLSLGHKRDESLYSIDKATVLSNLRKLSMARVNTGMSDTWKQVTRPT